MTYLYALNIKHEKFSLFLHVGLKSSTLSVLKQPIAYTQRKMEQDIG